ncbi:hypothetical protein CNX65_25095 [Actinosynnema pretiosum]|uniref:Uncharacterized protein n=1 Tax=Actinosynnema pretiosum TaxID=42197 RepID=A0A290ZAW4_9PSEU|nr:hypothetical protein CNX65_25095 [Actinosynnema pretiosum]
MSPIPDPVTGEPVHLAPVISTGWAAIWRRSTTVSGNATTTAAVRVTDHGALFERALSGVLVAGATVLDLTTGTRYVVDSAPGDRGGFLAAALVLISDMQEVPP